MGQGAATHEVRAAQVHLQNACRTTPVGQLLELATASAEAHVVDQHVEAGRSATAPDGAFAAVLGGDVGRVNKGIAAGRFDHRQRLSARCGFTIQEQTRAPSRANTQAIALPVPTPAPCEPAPVTSATLPASRVVMTRGRGTCGLAFAQCTGRMIVTRSPSVPTRTSSPTLEFRGELVERDFFAVEAATIRALVDPEASAASVLASSSTASRCTDRKAAHDRRTVAHAHDPDVHRETKAVARGS